MDTTLSLDQKNNAWTWDDWLGLYCSYKAEHKSEPVQKTVYCGRKIGMWCSTQRRAFRKGQLSPERTQKLIDVGFVLAIRTKTWDQWLQLYQSYKAEHGAEPLTDCVYQEQNLGLWCSNQRQAFHNGELSDNQVQRLTDNGFVFNAHDSTWNKWVALYCQYKNEFGYEPVRSTIYHGRRLGKWHEHQKSLYRKHQLSADRAKLLEEINYAKGPFYTEWPSMFELYLKYKQEHNCEPTARTVYQGKHIGHWCSEQRRNWHVGKLSQERIQALSSAGFYLSGRDAAWDKWLNLYREYKETTGIEPDGNVVFRDKKLGRWCVNQRSGYRNGKLSAARIQKLNDAGFPMARKKRR